MFACELRYLVTTSIDMCTRLWSNHGIRFTQKPSCIIYNISISTHTVRPYTNKGPCRSDPYLWLRVFGTYASLRFRRPDDSCTSFLLREYQTSANRSFPMVVPTIHLPVMAPKRQQCRPPHSPHTAETVLASYHISRDTHRDPVCARVTVRSL